MIITRAKYVAAALGCAVVLATQAAAPAWAQTASQTPVVKLTLHPKAIESPLLQYTLLPRTEETEPGNAAVHFINAVTSTLSAGRDAAKNDRMTELAKASLEELAAEEHLDDFRLSSNARNEMRTGAHRDSVDWGNTVRTDGAKALLPSLGSFRLLGQGMDLEARIAIKDHHWDEAVQAMQTNYALARDLGQGDTLIESLVAAAIASLTDDQVALFIQQPDAPNLFWALETLPHPLVDDQRGFRQERALMYYTFPELKDARLGKYYPGQWQSFVRHYIEMSGAFSNGHPLFGPEGDNVSVQQLAAAGFGLTLYGPAKHYLSSHGFTDQQLEAMPVEEALMRFTSAAYEIIGDEYTAWTLTPYWQSEPLAHGSEQALRNHPDLRIFPLTAIIPSLSRAEFNMIRTERGRAALTVIEALRDYAAHNNGALPEKLSDITDLPVPLDPVWNKPFEYTRTADSAALTSAPPPPMNPRDALRFEIRIEK